MQGNLPRTAGRLVPLALACRQRSQRVGLIDAAFLFSARCGYERLLAAVREERDADRDEFADLRKQWSRCRGGPGESAILAFGAESAWWLHPTGFVAIGLHLAGLPRQRCGRRPWSVAV